MKEQFTRRKIIKSAEDLFAAFDFSEVSVNSIANRAQVNISSIYYHYHSKEGLLEHILRETEQYIVLHFPGDDGTVRPIDQFLEYTADFLDKLLHDNNLLLIFLKARISNIAAYVMMYTERIEARVSAFLDGLLNQCRMTGALTLDIPNQIFINVFFIMMTEAGLYKRRYLRSYVDTDLFSLQEAFQVAHLVQLHPPIEALFKYILV